MMKDWSERVHLVCVLAVACVVGCGSEATKTVSSGSASVNASAAGPSASVDQADYCQRVCARATACGNEAALRTKNLDADTKSAIEKSASETVRACAKDCAAEATTNVRLQLAERCNEEKDCDAFSKCLTDLGKELRK